MQSHFPPRRMGISRKDAKGAKKAAASAIRRGFTLLEMIVATAIMSIAVVGLLSLIAATLSNAARVRQYDRAAMLARTKMNELLVSPLESGQPMAGQWDESTGWTARTDPFEKPPNARAGGSQLVRVGLEVWWKADGERKSITVEGFRREQIR
jgi:general secretion pathway protein I